MMEGGLFPRLPLSGYTEATETDYRHKDGYRQDGYKQDGYNKGSYKQPEFGGWDESYHPGGDSSSEHGITHTTPPYDVVQRLGVGVQDTGGEVRVIHSAPLSGDHPPDGADPALVSRHRRHRGRHHHRMRMHDSNVRRLLDVGGEELQHSKPHVSKMGSGEVPDMWRMLGVGGAEQVEAPCTCEGTDTAGRLGQWGSPAGGNKAQNPARPAPKPKKQPKTKRGDKRHRQRRGSAGMYHAPPGEDSFRFQHYEHVGLYVQQYRQEHTICIQGADPTRPAVLGRDTPDPYLAKLQQCGDLLERLMALTTMARQHAELGENRCEGRLAWVDLRASQKVPHLPEINEKHRTLQAIQRYRLNIRRRLQDRPLTKAVQSERVAQDFSSPDLSNWSHIKAQLPKKAINLTPMRDYHLSVKNIKFPQKQLPKCQAYPIQQQQQLTPYPHPLPTELATPHVSFPLAVRILVNSESSKGNKLTSSQPHVPTAGHRRLSRSGSTEHQEPANPTSNQSETRVAKKRTEGDLRCPQLARTCGSNPGRYDQYLVQSNKLGTKEDMTGHLLFAPVTKGLSCGGRNRKVTKPPPVGLCELYSSTSGTLTTAVHNR